MALRDALDQLIHVQLALNDLQNQVQQTNRNEEQVFELCRCSGFSSPSETRGAAMDGQKAYTRCLTSTINHKMRDTKRKRALGLFAEHSLPFVSFTIS